jgi:hypothetical protein
MNIRILLGIIFSLAALPFAGCGGGGGGTAAPTTTVVSGVAAKGQFTSGAVKIFGVNATTAAKGDLLKATALDALGTYSADIGSYSGPVVIEVIGTYNDEATGVPVVMAATDPPLRAVIANASGNVTAMVTPLTELAAKKVGATLTANSITTINGNIATLFKLDDITKTKPVDATTTAAATATAAEKNQSLVLAAISQLVQNSAGKKLDDVLTDLSTDISGSTMADRSIAGFKTALFDFMSDTAKNKTGITDTATAPVNIGSFKLAHLKINTAGLPAGTKIGGIDFTFNLPAGVTVAADAATKKVASGIVVISGGAAAAGTTSISTATFSAPALRAVLASAQGFGAGEFVNISCTIPAGNAATAASFTAAMTAATATVTDLTGAPLSGVTLTAIVDVF